MVSIMNSPNRHILFVNASPDEAGVYGFWFGSQGYRVSTASDAAAAARIVETDAVDAVVVDVRLSNGESGLALARGLTARPSRPSIVLLSGYLFPVEAVEGLCCDVCLIKPCVPNVLSGVVGRLLDHPPPHARVAPGFREHAAHK